MSRRWVCLYEDNPGGSYARLLEGRRYHRLEWTDMDDACGRDNQGHPRYSVGLRELDLQATPDSLLYTGLASCGLEGRTDLPDLQVLDALCQYGLGAPLGEWSSNNLRKAIACARRLSRELQQDQRAYEECMERPVNQMGTSALDFGHGIFPGLGTKVPEPPTAITVRTRQGSVLSVPSDDPLAFCSGFQTGLAGRPRPAQTGLAEAWLAGYREGVNVRAGAPWPCWATPRGGCTR